MSEELLKEAEQRMRKSVESVRREFNTVRTGKATPTLLDTVRVKAYESSMALNQVANVSAPEANLLVVQPYDQNIIDDIAHAIQAADLGLNPSVDGNLVRVPIPPLSEERRKEMVRMLHRMAEDGRVSIRQIRQNTKNELQEEERSSEIGEDRYHRLLERLQEMTDRHVAAVDELLERKEGEVMEV